MRPKRQSRSQGTVLLVPRGTVGEPWERGCPNGRTVTRLVTTPWTECHSSWQGYPQQYVPLPIYTLGKLEQVSCLRKQHVGKVRTIYCCWFEPVPADPKFEKQHQREANDLQCIRQRLNFHSFGKFSPTMFSLSVMTVVHFCW